MGLQEQYSQIISKPFHNFVTTIDVWMDVFI